MESTTSRTFGRSNRLVDRFELVHQRFVDLETARRVHDQNVVHQVTAPVQRLAGDLGRGSAVRLGEYGDPDLLAEDLELFDRGRPLDVAGRQHRLFALLLQQLRELGAGGRLSRTLKAAKQNDGRRVRVPAEPFRLSPEELDQLVADDFDDGLVRAQTGEQLLADRLLLHPPDELFGDLNLHVRF
ncbi:MAG: hypothetical protein SNJ76_08345, partial [Fimbriimonadaceae bacterium]